MSKSLARSHFFTKASIIALFFLFVRTINTSQGASEYCPLIRVSIYDLEVKVPPPAQGGTLPIEEWWGLYLVSKGVREGLLAKDSDKDSVDFADLQLAGHLTIEDPKDYPDGPPSNLAPPGPILDSDYIITGSVFQTNPIQINVSLQAAATKETLGNSMVLVDLGRPYESGIQAAQSLSPVMDKIRNFQNEKRSDKPYYALDPIPIPYPNVSLIGIRESTKVNIKVEDCDGKRYRSRSINLSSTLGQIEPQVVTTDENGEAEATFTAGKTPGYAEVKAEYEWKRPCGHGPFKSCEGTVIAIEQRPVDVWTVTATVSENVTRKAKKTHKLGEVSIPPDHPLIKSGTHKIRKHNMLHSTQQTRATLQMVIKVDANGGDFIYSGEEPLALVVSGNASKRDKEERIEYINKYISEFSTKRQDNYNGVFDEGSLEFHYTSDYQYVSVYAGSKGQVHTKIERFEDEHWRSNPYTIEHSLGIGAGWSSGQEGGSITRTKSGYSFTYRHTETERKETSDFGIIITITTITMNGAIKPFSNKNGVGPQQFFIYQ
jgi:hypothetical protein